VNKLNTSNQSGLTMHGIRQIPDSSHYDVSYVGTARFHSFAHQLSSIIALRPKSVLEIGVGTRITAEALRLLKVRVTTADIAESLRPDIVADVTSMPVEDDAFDVTLCCQVLEHLPFHRFRGAMQELHRVTSRAMVVSLPDQNRYLEVSFHVPRLGRRRFAWSPPRLRPAVLPRGRFEEMAHYWEIGFCGYSLRRTCAVIRQTGWAITKTWRVPGVPWHRFFLLCKS